MENAYHINPDMSNKNRSLNTLDIQGARPKKMTHEREFRLQGYQPEMFPQQNNTSRMSRQIPSQQQPQMDSLDQLKNVLTTKTSKNNPEFNLNMEKFYGYQNDEGSQNQQVQNQNKSNQQTPQVNQSNIQKPLPKPKFEMPNYRNKSINVQQQDQNTQIAPPSQQQPLKKLDYDFFTNKYQNINNNGSINNNLKVKGNYGASISNLHYDDFSANAKRQYPHVDLNQYLPNVHSNLTRGQDIVSNQKNSIQQYQNNFNYYPGEFLNQKNRNSQLLLEANNVVPQPIQQQPVSATLNKSKNMNYITETRQSLEIPINLKDQIINSHQDNLNYDKMIAQNRYKNQGQAHIQAGSINRNQKIRNSQNNQIFENNSNNLVATEPTQNYYPPPEMKSPYLEPQRYYDPNEFRNISGNSRNNQVSQSVDAQIFAGKLNNYSEFTKRQQILQGIQENPSQVKYFSIKALKNLDNVKLY